MIPVLLKVGVNLVVRGLGALPGASRRSCLRPVLAMGSYVPDLFLSGPRFVVDDGGPFPLGPLIVNMTRAVGWGCRPTPIAMAREICDRACGKGIIPGILVTIGHV